MEKRLGGTQIGHDGGNGTRGCGPHPPSQIKRARLVSGWSQKALSEAAGIDRHTLAALEAGRTRPQLKTAEALARVLGQSIQTIFTDLRPTSVAVPSAYDAPQVATVDLPTLRAIRSDLRSDAATLADVDHLIEMAEQAGWPL
jgi:DNA-binding XRE family transcriptional regulator